jgi:hypothetical protein
MCPCTLFTIIFQYIERRLKNEAVYREIQKDCGVELSAEPFYP